MRKPASPPEPTWKAPIKPLAAPLFNLDEFIAPVILFATAKPFEHPNNMQINAKTTGPFWNKLLFPKNINTVQKEQTVPKRHILSRPTFGHNLLFTIFPKIYPKDVNENHIPNSDILTPFLSNSYGMKPFIAKNIEVCIAVVIVKKLKEWFFNNPL